MVVLQGCSEDALTIPKRRSRTHVIPSVAIMIDGVLAKRYQHTIDTLCLEGHPGFRGVVDENDLPATPPAVYSGCDRQILPPDVQALREACGRRRDYWTDMPSYQDVDFPALRSSIHQGEFLGHFLACRYQLEADDVDYRYLTRCWLDERFVPGLEADSVNAELRPEDIVPWLKLIRADYFLTSDLDQALEARAASIAAFVIDRGWNRGIRLPFRVASVDDFLAQTVYKPRD